MLTDKLFTGQREMAGLGIYHYGARFYSPKLGRFLSPDTMIPGMANPQAWNRYSYVYNNPVLYNDPTGHFAILGVFIAPLLVAVAVGALALATCNAISPCHDAMVDGISNARDNFSQMAKGYNKTPGREIPKYNPENSFLVRRGRIPVSALENMLGTFAIKLDG